MLATDYHSHLIPGVDDGSRSEVETITMARGLEDLGVKRVYATPHRFRFAKNLTPDEVHDEVGKVQALLDRAGIELEVRAGTEHLYCEAFLDALARGDDLLAFERDTKDGPERCLLVELPLHQPVVGVGRMAARIQRDGIRPVMAHPERVTTIFENRDRLLGWRSAGWSFQLDLMALVGGYGREPRALAHDLLAADCYDLIGGDLHRPAQLDTLARAHEAWRTLTAGKGSA